MKGQAASRGSPTARRYTRRPESSDFYSRAGQMIEPGNPPHRQPAGSATDPARRGHRVVSMPKSPLSCSSDDQLRVEADLAAESPAGPVRDGRRSGPRHVRRLVASRAFCGGRSLRRPRDGSAFTRWPFKPIYGGPQFPRGLPPGLLGHRSAPASRPARDPNTGAYI